MSGSPVLEMKDITKIYGNGIIANYKVNFNLNKGEIHALAGENGAGKSTLMKILFGMENFDEGSITLEGMPYKVASSEEAIAAGVGMVHQHFMLVPSLTVAENIVLGHEYKKYGLFLDYKTINQKTQELSLKYGLAVDPGEKVQNLSVSSKQKIEILKALLRNAKILILDEPTAVLTPQETSELFERLRQLRDEGYTIIFISHKLNEIKELCDRITIMRGGRSEGTYPVSEISVQEISRLMIGKDIDNKLPKNPAQRGKTVLEVKGVSFLGSGGREKVKDVSFVLRSKEILAIAGVEGNGQRELIDIVTGLEKIQKGDVLINGVSIKGFDVKKIREHGLAHIPEDRMVLGSAVGASIKDNLMSDRIDSKKYNRFNLLNKKVIDEQTQKWTEEYLVKTDTTEREVGMLSGGNIQKVVVAREMTSDFDLLVADQPSRGIDVGAARFIHEQIIKSRDLGGAVLLVSADLSEVMNLCDSLMVMYDGQIYAYFESTENLTEEELGYYMLGVKRQEPDEIRRRMGQ